MKTEALEFKKYQFWGEIFGVLLRFRSKANPKAVLMKAPAPSLRRRSIRGSLFILLASITLFTVTAGTVAVSLFVRKPLKQNVENSLERSEQIIQSLLSERRGHMRDQAKLIGELPILATVIEQGRANTVQDSARAYREKLNLQILDVVSDAGKLLASVEAGRETGNRNSPDSDFLLSKALGSGTPVDGFAIRSGHLALLAAACAGIADEPSGAILVGMYMDDSFANQIKTLTKTEVTFLIGKTISGSTLTGTDRTQDLEKILLAVKGNLKSSGSWINEKILLDTGDDLIQLRPVRDLSGNNIGTICFQISLRESQSVLSGIRNLQISVGLVVIFVAILAGFFFTSRMVVGPIQSLKKGTEIIGGGNLDHVVPVQFEDEIGLLARYVNNMTLRIKESQKALIGQKQLEEQLKIAALIQISQYPEAPVQESSFKICGYSRAAKIIGGDYYFFKKINDRWSYWVVADVSGKGVPAALMAYNLGVVIRTVIENIPDVDAGRVITEVNRSMLETLRKNGRFATMMLCFYDSENRVIRCSSAGHGELLVYRNQSQTFEMVECCGFPVGLNGESVYPSAEVVLQDGDSVPVFTDGITEARNTVKEEYGYNRFCSRYAALAQGGAEEILEKMKVDFDAFIGEEDQFDDSTLIVFKQKKMDLWKS